MNLLVLLTIKSSSSSEFILESNINIFPSLSIYTFFNNPSTVTSNKSAVYPNFFRIVNDLSGLFYTYINVFDKSLPNKIDLLSI